MTLHSFTARSPLTWLLAVAFAVIPVLNFADEGLELPDPGPLPDNGRLSLAIYPVIEGRVVGGSGCTVHLMAHPALTSESTFPCGRWFQPAVARYNTWVEHHDMISAAVSVMTYAGEKAKNAGKRITMPLVASGRLALHRADWPETAEARFLAYGRAPVVFERRSDLRRAFEGVALPTGPAFGGIFAANGDALALTRPVELKAGATTAATPQLPERGTDVFVVINRDSSDQQDDSDLVLRGETDEHPPDVLVRTRYRIYGVWYGVPGKNATVQLRSKRDVLAPAAIALDPGSVVTFRSRAKKRA